jgi:hypothetical protein
LEPRQEVVVNNEKGIGIQDTAAALTDAEEVDEAIKRLKNHKADGPDELPSDGVA